MASKSRKRVGATVVALGMAASIYFAPNIINAKQNNLTGADMISNHFMTSYLQELEEEKNVTFQNKELYDIFANHFGGSFTVEDLHSLTSLTFEVPLTNNDLSDFKYLTNLKSLTIKNNCVDCSDLRYNQDLTKIVLWDCTVVNSEELPNTITSVELLNCDVADDVLVTPFNTNLLSLQNTTLLKTQFKNPEALKSFYFSGYGFVDINDLRDCTSLKVINLTRCPNVLNPKALMNFTEANITLDEFCTVWLNSKSIDNIPSLSSEKKEQLKKISNSLDNTLSGLISSDMSEEEKINNIIIYVLNQIEYDYKAIEDTEEGKELCGIYNQYPLTYALKSNDGVCVGYATLFTALANRAGIDSYQPDSATHTWNMVRKMGEYEYSAYDLTQLDHEYASVYEDGSIVNDINRNAIDYIISGESEKLAFYNSDLDETLSKTYETNVEAKQVSEKEFSIGYLKEITPKEQNNIRLKVAGIEAIVAAYAYALHLALSKPKKNTSSKKYTKKKENQQVIKYKRIN